MRWWNQIGFALRRQKTSSKLAFKRQPGYERLEERQLLSAAANASSGGYVSPSISISPGAVSVVAGCSFNLTVTASGFSPYGTVAYDTTSESARDYVDYTPIQGQLQTDASGMDPLP